MILPVDFLQTFKEQLIPILYKLFYTTEKRIILLNSLYGASINLMAPLEKNVTKKKNCLSTLPDVEVRKKTAAPYVWNLDGTAF